MSRVEKRKKQKPSRRVTAPIGFVRAVKAAAQALDELSNQVQTPGSAGRQSTPPWYRSFAGEFAHDPVFDRIVEYAQRERESDSKLADFRHIEGLHLLRAPT